MAQDSKGIKFDGDKPNLTYIPKEAMFEMGKALSYGAKKYGANNYRNGMEASRQIAAALRHIYDHLDGETFDSESGITNIGHALASLAMACYTLNNHKHLDDRFVGDLEKHNNKGEKNGI